jgi:chromosome segregation ATPase
MKKYVLDFICKLEGFKTGIKQLHWDANSLSQHQLCDDIATTISDYQDKVSEVEQSISGKLPVNNLKGTAYKITTLKKFVEDVIRETKSFYSKLKKEGDGYIGMRSDTEAVLSDLQRQLYLVNFTIKESLKERLRDKINENRVTISNGREQYSLTENELREYVSKAIGNVKAKINESKRYPAATEDDFDAAMERIEELAEQGKRMCRDKGLYQISSLFDRIAGQVNYLNFVGLLGGRY